MSEIVTTWETEKKSSNPREIGDSWLFTTRFSNQKVQSRRPARRKCLFVLLLCLGRGRSEEHPGIPGPSVVSWKQQFIKIFPVLWEKLVLEHHTANVHHRATP